MAGMGPPPKPASQRRRTNATIATTQLPAEGRQGDPPAWPLAASAAYDEQTWRDLWSSPQAVAWERLGIGCIRMVARYVVLLAEAEVGEPKAAMEVRQLEDRLGLSPMAMRRLLWEIAADDTAAARPRPAPRSTAATRRERVLEVIDGGRAS